MESWRLPKPYEVFGLIYAVAEYATWAEVFPIGSIGWHTSAFVRFVSVGLGLNAARLTLSKQVLEKVKMVDEVARRALNNERTPDVK